MPIKCWEDCEFWEKPWIDWDGKSHNGNCGLFERQSSEKSSCIAPQDQRVINAQISILDGFDQILSSNR